MSRCLKKISFASTARVEAFAHIATEFMEEVFDLLPGDYIISDESELRDFMELGSSETSVVWARIYEVFGIDRAHGASNRLVDIFVEIDRRRHPQ